MGILAGLKSPGGAFVRRKRFNDLIDRLDAVLQVEGGAGVNASVSAAGFLLAISGGKDRFAWGKIVVAPPVGVPVLPSACKYDIQLISKGPKLTQVLPVYGRPCTNDEVHIYPAKVGHLVLILKNPQADGTVKPEVFVLTEEPVRGDC